MRNPWQSEVHDLPTVACLLSGRTEVRTPDTWFPDQDPFRNHQRKEALKIRLSTHLSVDGKYGSNGSQAVDVGRSIQWVKADHIFPLNAQREEPPIKSPSDQHSLCKWLYGADDTISKSYLEQRDIFTKKCTYLWIAECISIYECSYTAYEYMQSVQLWVYLPITD